MSVSNAVRQVGGTQTTLHTTKRGSVWFGAVFLALYGVACSAPVGDDAEEQGAAISSKEASAEFAGAKEVYSRTSTDQARTVGVFSWAVYAVKQNGFTGTMLFGEDRDGDVKYAIFVGQRADARSGQGTLALVNYSKTGKAGATSNDNVTLAALKGDFALLHSEIEADHRQNVRDCAKAVAIFGIAGLVVSSGILVGFPVALAVTSSWVSTIISTTGLAVSASAYFTITVGGFGLPERTGDYMAACSKL